MNTVTLVTGGGRSGKSRHALCLALAHRSRRAFVATAVPFDDEMRDRAMKHQEERGEAFLTIEEPHDPARALGSLPADVGVAVVDCLTVWLGNLMFRRENAENDEGEYLEIRRFLDLLDAPPCDLVIVTNEVGMGIVPENAMARRFRDLAGRVNQQVARRADRVILMISGIPVNVKGGAE